MSNQTFKAKDEVIDSQYGWGVVQSGNDTEGYEVGFGDILAPDEFPVHVLLRNVKQLRLNASLSMKPTTIVGSHVAIIPEGKFGKVAQQRITQDGTTVYKVSGLAGEFDDDELIWLSSIFSENVLQTGLRWIANLETDRHYIIGNPAMYDFLKAARLVEDAPELGAGKTRLTTRGENAVHAFNSVNNQQDVTPVTGISRPVANHFWKKSGTIRQSFRTVLVEIDGRKYDTNRITEASFKRLRAVLNDPSVEKIVEFDDYDLTPTVYFYYGKLK